jgi:hypothetical protein
MRCRALLGHRPWVVFSLCPFVPPFPSRLRVRPCAWVFPGPLCCFGSLRPLAGPLAPRSASPSAFTPPSRLLVRPSSSRSGRPAVSCLPLRLSLRPSGPLRLWPCAELRPSQSYRVSRLRRDSGWYGCCCVAQEWGRGDARFPAAPGSPSCSSGRWYAASSSTGSNSSPCFSASGA